MSLALPSPPGSQHAVSSNATKVSPSEWSVDDVVEWAKSKGFDDSVCDKFIGRYFSIHIPCIGTDYLSRA